MRFSSIGDIVLTTPVIRCLKKQVDDSEVHFLTKKQYSQILENNPYIDRLWLYDRDLRLITKKLKEERFDFIIDLHHNLRTFILKSKLRLISFSFPKLNLEKWLLVRFRWNSLPDIHIVDRYLTTIKQFDAYNDGKGLDYFLSDVKSLIPAQIDRILPERFIALSIGAQHNTKKVPPDKLAYICSRLILPVVILGGETDINASNEIIRLCSGKNVINLAGKLSINGSALIIKKSEFVITHDTGLMHIAAAFKKRTISIWGNTIPEFGMYPYLPGEGSRIFEVSGLRCRPCSKLGFNECPKGHFKCMKEQDYDNIIYFSNQIKSD